MPPSRTPGKHALLFIFLTLLIDVTGLGIIIPVLPRLIQELTGRTVDDAAVIGGLIIMTYALMQFVAAPVVGAASDRFGRRPVLLLSLLGFSIDYMIMGLATSIVWLFIGRALSGVFGATYTTAGAYIADVSPPEKRAQNFGLIGAAFGIGFIVGPAIGGALGHFDPRLPFFTASALAMGNLVYGWIVLPETLKPENRRPFDPRRANPFGALMQIRLYPAVLGLLGAAFLFQLAHQAYPSIWAYYGQERYGWTALEVGLSLGAVGVMAALVQGGLTRVVMPKIGAERALYIGLALVIVSFVGFAFATRSWMVYAWIPISGLGGLAGPAMQGLMSNRVPDNAQGELQGASASLVSLTTIISPPLLTRLFAHFSGDDAPLYLPGAPYLAGAALTALGLMVAVWALHGGGFAARSAARGR